jgi:hypothetical protein
VILLLAIPAAANSDISILLSEIAEHASPELINDLGDPSVLPSDGIHRAVYYWDTQLTDIPGGALALVLPTGVRVGLALRELEAQRVRLTYSPSVLRLLTATDNWNKLQNTQRFIDGLHQVGNLVRLQARAQQQDPDTPLAMEVLGRASTLTDLFSVPDHATASGRRSEPEPEPGELQCFYMYKFRGHHPDAPPCSGDGPDCWIPVCCQGGPEGPEC